MWRPPGRAALFWALLPLSWGRPMHCAHDGGAAAKNSAPLRGSVHAQAASSRHRAPARALPPLWRPLCAGSEGFTDTRLRAPPRAFHTQRERAEPLGDTAEEGSVWSARAARSKRPARAYMALSATWPTRTASISAVRSERAAHHTSRSPQSPPPAPGGHQIGRRHFRPSTTELDPYHPSAPQAPRSRTCGRPALFECSIT